MILTVTLNAAIDKRYVVDGFQVGEVNRVKECAYTPGGKGLNVSKPASIAGADVTATGFVGGHAGNYIVDSLKPFGIKSEFYHMEAESRSCINIWDEVNHVQTEFLEPGFTVSEEDFQKLKEIAIAADTLCTGDSALEQAVYEVGPDALNGKMSVEDAVGEICRRAAIYLAE